MDRDIRETKQRRYNLLVARLDALREEVNHAAYVLNSLKDRLSYVEGEALRLQEELELPTEERQVA